MTTSWNRNMVFGQVLVEFLLLNLCLFGVFYGSYSTGAGPNFENEIFLTGYIPWLLLFNASWILTIIINAGSEYYRKKSTRVRLRFLLLNAFILVGAVYSFANLFRIQLIDQSFITITIFLFFLLDLFLLRLREQYYKKRKENLIRSKALIVSGRKKNQIPELTSKVQHHGYNVVGWLNPDPVTQSASSFVTGQVEELSNVLSANLVDEIFISLPSMEEQEVERVIKTADYHGVRVNLIPDTPNFLTLNLKKPFAVEYLPIIQLRQSPLDQFENYLIKQLFDFAFASFVILLLSPVFIIIGLLILIESKGKGSILYTPIRKGERGTSFKCYKFRTMIHCDDPVNGTRSTEKNDPRITWVGKFLRKNDLDELPQFFNVLKGDMSVVGPRPHRVHLHNDFRQIVNEYMVRHYVKPGITGWAQVNGWRGPTKTIEQKKERVDHDLWYIENWSFWLDIKIIFLTVFGKKTRKNAF